MRCRQWDNSVAETGEPGLLHLSGSPISHSTNRGLSLGFDPFPECGVGAWGPEKPGRWICSPRLDLPRSVWASLCMNVRGVAQCRVRSCRFSCPPASFQSRGAGVGQRLASCDSIRPSFFGFPAAVLDDPTSDARGVGQCFAI